MSPQYNNWGDDLGMGLAQLGQGLSQLEQDYRRRKMEMLDFLIKSQGGDYKAAAAMAQKDPKLSKAWRYITGSDPNPESMQYSFKEQQERQSAAEGQKAYDDIAKKYGPAVAHAVKSNPNLMQGVMQVMMLPEDQQTEALQGLLGKANLTTYSKILDLGGVVDPEVLGKMGVYYPNKVPTSMGQAGITEAMAQWMNPATAVTALPAALQNVPYLFTNPEPMPGARASRYGVLERQGDVRLEQKQQEVDIKKVAEERKKEELSIKWQKYANVDLPRARAYINRMAQLAQKETQDIKSGISGLPKQTAAMVALEAKAEISDLDAKKDIWVALQKNEFAEPDDVAKAQAQYEDAKKKLQDKISSILNRNVQKTDSAQNAPATPKTDATSTGGSTKRAVIP